EIYAELVVELLVGDLADACDLQDRGVCEHHVEAPAAVGHRGIEPVEILRLAHVTLHTSDVVAEFFDRGLQFGLPTTGNEDVCALLDEPFGGGQPDTGRASGDYRCLAPEKCHHRAFREFWTIRSITTTQRHALLFRVISGRRESARSSARP